MTSAPSSRTSSLVASVAEGVRDMSPYALGYVPYAIFVGTVVARAVDPLAAWAGTVPIYGGGAHVALLDLLAAGASLPAAAAVAALLNARVAVYSADLSRMWVGAALWQRMIAAAVVIDVTWSVALQRAERGGSLRERRAHYAGAAAALTTIWLAAVTAGWSLAAPLGRLADGVALQSMVPLCLLALVAAYGRRVPGATALVAAAVVALGAASARVPVAVVVPASMAAAALAGAAIRRARPAQAVGRAR